MPAFRRDSHAVVAPVTELSGLQKQMDPSLRLILWLIKNKDFKQLEARTGINRRNAKREIPVTVELDQVRLLESIAKLKQDFRIPQAYIDEIDGGNVELRHVTGRLPVDEEVFEGETGKLETQIQMLVGVGKRASFGTPALPCEAPSLGEAIGMPKREYGGTQLSGEGVVVGIIDDGCALAHWNFINWANQQPSSRILALWDQGGTGGNHPTGFDYGHVLNQLSIDTALRLCCTPDGVIDEEAVYADLGYRPSSTTSHGTHVMDIATGNGNSLMAAEGVAPGADIIFVQLPPAAVEEGALALEQFIVDGAAFVFQEAERAGKSGAVVNISYGGYDGPHDGTSPLERGLDALLSRERRAIVIAAGNGFEARCHASATIPPNTYWPLHWMIPAEDPTPSDIEIWYPNDSRLQVQIVAPPGEQITPSEWLPLEYARTNIKLANGKVIGCIEHAKSSTSNGDNVIVVNLRATQAAQEDGVNASPPPGTWQINLFNERNQHAAFHAWIHRDDSGRPAEARRRQSRFRVADSVATHTMTGWATGARTISVGALNTGTNAIAAYSACGPTRKGDRGPDTYAPAEQLAGGGGLLSASSLSANPTRMNGTSAAAPVVAGLVALAMEYGASPAQRGKPLTAERIRSAIQNGSDNGPGDLTYNRHQAADDRIPAAQKQEQANVRGDLVPYGRINFEKMMADLFPRGPD